MRRISALVFGTLLSAAPGLAQEAPASCAPNTINPGGLTAEEIDAAKLRCDVDRAMQLAQRAENTFGESDSFVVRIIDTLSPSGAAYVYNVSDIDGGFLLDARTVPGDTGPDKIIPVCQLRTLLPTDASSSLNTDIGRALDGSLPGYGERAREIINPDGSRTFELLFNTHDIITQVQTEDGTKNFSRHAEADDLIARLNASIIEVANMSDEWECNPFDQDTN